MFMRPVPHKLFRGFVLWSRANRGPAGSFRTGRPGMMGREEGAGSRVGHRVGTNLPRLEQPAARDNEATGCGVVR